VHGKVTLNGQPLSEGQVNFYSGTTGVGSDVSVKPDGTYALPQPIAVGDYVIYVTPPVPVPDDPGPDAPAAPSVEHKGPRAVIPGRYRTEATSPLKSTVKEGANEIAIELTP
jgi:hypothetical protein